MKGEASDQLTVISGVSQGSLLGPIFFIVYINDLWGGGGGLISKDSSIALYTNDSKLYRLSEKNIIAQKRKASRARDKKPASPH